MKKFILGSIVTIFVVTSFLGTASSLSIIPDEAIRIRIVPNSNEEVDVDVKNKVKQEIEPFIYNILKDVTTIEESREIIKNNLSTIEKNVNTIFNDNNYSQVFDVNFGFNYFPEKTFKGVKYDEGMYESLVISIGEAKGDNWWCVLYPPFCMLETEDVSDVEYQFYIEELIQKYF